MQTVFRFIEHDAMRAVDNRSRNLFAAVRGETVHKDHIILGAFQEGIVDLIGNKMLGLHTELTRHFLIKVKAAFKSSTEDPKTA